MFLFLSNNVVYFPLLIYFHISQLDFRDILFSPINNIGKDLILDKNYRLMVENIISEK